MGGAFLRARAQNRNRGAQQGGAFAVGLARRGLVVEPDHQALLAARHCQEDLGEQLRVEQRAVLGAVGIVDAVPPA